MPTNTQSVTNLPTIAIVGRPNVGKSTLFNRLIGRRRSIVGDEPGITRDRIYGVAEWLGRHLRIVDTGGIIPEDKQLIPAEIFRQARVALEEADAIVMVVDARTELAGPDMELSRLLLKTGKPLFLAVNKVDGPELEAAAENFRTLGIRNLCPVSAEHGNGVAELLEAITEVLPPPSEEEKAVTAEPDIGDTSALESEAEEGSGEANEESTADVAPSEVKVAIIGRPNVGKSTLLNRLTGSSRSIVSPIPGTTRDAVDEVIERDGTKYRFIDTAGIRRKGKTELVAEKLSVVMARKHMEGADVALMIIDGLEGVTALDAHIAGYAHESGRSVIIVVNKWDLVTKRAKELKETNSLSLHKRGVNTARRAAARDITVIGDQKAYEENLRRQLKFLNYAPVIFVSAVAGKNIDKLFELVYEVAKERRKRIGTGEMNRFLKNVDFERASVPYSRRVRILYMTQAAVSPPTFILFTDRDVKLHFSYQRYLENQIRGAFGFLGAPIWIKVRARNKKD